MDYQANLVLKQVYAVNLGQSFCVDKVQVYKSYKEKTVMLFCSYTDNIIDINLRMFGFWHTDTELQVD